MPADRALHRLAAQTEGKLAALVDHLAAGALTAATWHGRALAVLADAHALAGYHGRVRAGDTAPYDVDDVRFGALVAQEEQPYLERFAAELAGDRYRDAAGALDREAVTARARLYSARLYGTANEALVLVDGARVWWRLGDTDHCRQCVALAEGSPYEPGALRVYPRTNATLCKQNCGCRVETESGLATFTPA